MEIINEKELIDLGYLKKTVHENGELFLYNYTNKAQFDKAWEQYPQLLQCRGLILDIEGNVIARPFAKFFNIEEVKELPCYNSFEITDKLDGSLIIVSWYKDDMIVSTRGSFNSDQANVAKTLLTKIKTPKSGHTFLFELIGRKNQIVVNYDNDYELVLLAIINNRTGEEYGRITLDAVEACYGFRVVQFFDGISDFRNCRELLKRDNAEGFVVKFNNGYRVKLKYDDYVRLHKLMTGISEKDILDMIKNKQDINTLLDRVPDEYYKWVHSVINRINHLYSNIEFECNNYIPKIKEFTTRKEQAVYILNHYSHYSTILFKMLDNREYSDIIYKLIEKQLDGTHKFKVEN